MLGSIPAMSSFSVDDIDAARAFYGGVLGLQTEDDHGMLLLTLGTGGKVLVYPKDDHAPSTYTVLMFPVPDIDAAVAEAKAAGVTFEMLPGVGEDGIMRGGEMGPPNSWFKDPAGNWLSILQVG